MKRNHEPTRTRAARPPRPGWRDLAFQALIILVRAWAGIAAEVVARHVGSLF